MRSATVAAALAAVLTPTIVSAVTCYKGAYILSARGTNELRNDSSLIPIGTAASLAIPDSYYEEIDYPASFQLVKSTLLGVNDLRTRLTDYYNSCPDGKTVLLGYSQGAIVIDLMLAGGTFQDLKNSKSNLTRFIPNLQDLENVTVPASLSQNIGNNIAAILTYGDGTWAPQQGAMPLCDPCKTNATLPLRPLGGPYYDNMERYASRLQDNCHAEDPLCCATGANGLAHLLYFNLDTETAAVNFIKEKFAAAAGTTASAFAATVTQTSPQSCLTIFGDSSTATALPTTTGSGAGTTPTSPSGTTASQTTGSRTSSSGGGAATATGSACRAPVAGQALGALAAALCAGSLLI